MPLPRATNAIQKYFLDLTQAGLDKVDAAGVDRLFDFCASNEIDRFERRPTSGGEVSELERRYLGELLDDQRYQTFLSDEARSVLEIRLGRQSGTTGSYSGRDVALESGTLTRCDLSGLETSRLTESFLSELRTRADIFANPAVSSAERGKKLYFLFSDYAKALRARPQDAEWRAEQKKLLQAIAPRPEARLYLFADPDGDGFATAFELVHGTRPDRPENRFPERAVGWSTYQNMHGSFYEIAAKLDEVMKARGEPACIAAHERRSAVAWLMGEPSGNTVESSLDEWVAIGSTSGVDFVKGLFPTEHRIHGLRLVDGFDIAVDFLDATGAFVAFDRNRGDRMAALELETRETLDVSIEEVVVPGEDLPRYRPIFTKDDGARVSEKNVMLVILDSSGAVKGDGRTRGRRETGWWGFCDRNALNELVTTRFDYPAPDCDVTLQLRGGAITFSAAEILAIVGRRLTEVVNRYEYTGLRFDDELDRVELRDGTVLFGRLSGKVDLHRPDVVTTGDRARLCAPAGEDVLSRVAVSVTRFSDASGGSVGFVACEPDGDTFAIEAEDLPGGFRGRARQLVAWSPSSADREALSSLLLAYVDAHAVGAREAIPNADTLSVAVDGVFTRLAREPALDVAASLDVSKDEGRFLARWSRTLEGASDRVKLYLPALSALKALYAECPEGPRRDARVAALVSSDVLAGRVATRLADVASNLRVEIGLAEASAFRLSSREQRAQKLLGWFDAADADKVSKISAKLARDPNLAGSLDLVFRALPQEKLTQGLEAFRMSRLEAARNEQREYRARLLDTITSLRSIELAPESDASDRPPRHVFVFGSDDEEPGACFVSKDELSFGRIARTARSEPNPELEALHASLETLVRASRERGTPTRDAELMSLPPGTRLPQRLELTLADGSTRRLRSADVALIEREMTDDLTLEDIIAHVKRNDGVTNADSWLDDGVSNGLHLYTGVRDYGRDDDNAPEWVRALRGQPLFGRAGEVRDPSRVRFFDLGFERNGYWSSTTRGWIERDEDEMPVNSVVLNGAYDFLWTIEGKPDWDAPPTFNPNVPNDLVLELYVRSISDATRLESLASRGLLPDRWREYRA